MKTRPDPAGGHSSSRRDFIKSSTLAATLATGISPALLGVTRKGKKDLNVAIVGTGKQGRVLLDASGAVTGDPARKLPGIHFKAVCDIWIYNRRFCLRTLKRLKHDVKEYTDYEEMLEDQKDLDVVIVATPDFMHAPITNACLRAGLDVYCEAPMAHTVEAARSMIEASRESGRLLQIGQQRRSNPRYRHVYDNLLGKAQFLGRINHVTGFWNRGVLEPIGWPKNKGYQIDQATLARHGYPTMFEFRNWRNYRKYSAGRISELGSHQIDVFSWWLNADPTSVMAGGGIDYYKNTEQYDNAIAIYEYKTKQGTVRGEYHMFSTTSAGGGYNETFIGDEGNLRMSENPRWTGAYQEIVVPGTDDAPPWHELVEKGWLTAPKKYTKEDYDDRWSGPRFINPWQIPVKLDKPIHQPHLENFFAAVRGEAKLNAPAETAFKSTVATLAVNQSIAEGRRIDFKPSDFEA